MTKFWNDQVRRALRRADTRFEQEEQIVPRKTQDTPENTFRIDPVRAEWAPQNLLDVRTDQVIISRDATVVQLTARVDTGFISVTGAAKRFPGGVDASGVKRPADKHDPETALLLATGRALESLARKMQRQANGRVKHNDDKRIQHSKASTKTGSRYR